MRIEETWAAVDIVQPNEVRNEYNRRQKECVRALALAAHDDVCGICGQPNLINAPCSKRRRIEELL